MQVKQAMSQKPDILAANATVRECAQHMKQLDTGFVPIAKDDRLIGVITDRDLAVRVLADGKSPDDPVSSVETQEVLYCMEDDDIREVLKNMREQEVQRLIVLDNPQDKDLVGVISLSDIADHCDEESGIAEEVARACRHYH
ncbi:CBS domain-containing protein [Gilvimarinus sp. F26214L]|uniref:CBS domain-containing protein n=1 Tax=Gilvimarinus sp. DZF01 TaxID=3461371 RepID=UPI004045D239